MNRKLLAIAGVAFGLAVLFAVWQATSQDAREAREAERRAAAASAAERVAEEAARAAEAEAEARRVALAEREVQRVQAQEEQRRRRQRDELEGSVGARGFSNGSGSRPDNDEPGPLVALEEEEEEVEAEPSTDQNRRRLAEIAIQLGLMTRAQAEVIAQARGTSADVILARAANAHCRAGGCEGESIRATRDKRPIIDTILEGLSPRESAASEEEAIGDWLDCFSTGLCETALVGG